MFAERLLAAGDEYYDWGNDEASGPVLRADASDNNSDDSDDSEDENSGASFSTAFNVLKFVSNIKRSTRKRKLLQEYTRSRKMMKAAEYDALHADARKFFGISDDQSVPLVSVNSSLTDSLIKFVEAERQEDSVAPVLTRRLLEKAKVLVDCKDAVAIFALFKFADDPFQLRRFLNYRITIDDERRRRERQREERDRLWMT